MNLGQNHVYNQERNSMNLPFSPKHDASLMESTRPSKAANAHANRKQRNVNSLMNLGHNHFHIIKKGTA